MLTGIAPAVGAVARTDVRPSDGQLVLVVEDNSDIREMVAEALEMDGYRVSTAPNGRTALEQVHVCRPDLIVLDLMMPVMTGWQLLTALRAAPELASVPVVVVTAFDDALPEGAVAFVRKPFRLETLLSTVAWASNGEPSLPDKPNE
jgi:CheY-like chemotaxis protein